MFKTNNRVMLRDGRVTTASRGGQGTASQMTSRKPITSSLEWGATTGGANSSQFASNNPSLDTFLSGFINAEDETVLRKVYKDIYENDPICGGIIDLMSELPFSDFTLAGIDGKFASKYQESIDRLSLKTLLPEITAEYLTYSKFCGTLIYQQKSKIFTDMMPHDPDYFTVQEMPFYSMDPIITVRNDKRIKDFLSSQDPEVERWRNGLSPKLLEALRSDTYVLDPLTAVYLERRSLMKRGPISLLRRVIPIYFLEKQLFRGTLVEASKRLRAIGHLRIGNDKWVATPDEMQEYLDWFQQADQDPLGAIVATRDGIEFEEVRQAGEFWKFTDSVDVTSDMKLRAMGVSEAFLSGDANYDTAEVAVSIFMDHTKSYRDQLTYKLFTTKIFPIIAITNGFIKQKKSETTADLHRRVQYEINNTSNFEIPNIQWHKQLTADPNNNMLDTLDKLHGMGVPATLRAICAAGNVSLEALMRDVEEERPLIQKLTDMGYDMSRFLPEGSGGGGGSSGGDEEEPDNSPGGRPGKDGWGDDSRKTDDGTGQGVGPVSDEGKGEGGEQSSSFRQVYAAFRPGFINRDWSSVAQEPYALTRTGKKKSIVYPHRHGKQVNEMIVKAVLANSDPHTQASNVKRAVTHKLGGLPFLDGGKR